ncbi:SH3 domain-containing protein [Pseudomonas sp. CCI3.1]|uniref:SH3 domain-containing protein n=1 Tax=Pseudomonas sp. CCI3.1 TaxID=3048618 RepID=UPI002AB5C048|nr:SH3 domain-containing protein [Pseudomonas sp. CCI3.1]MDY7580633.1 SH3 domain-containing protein [Pseudomonas sp. CCI3.1]MEB0066256.1 SH3 domain-containing protein [Pseudomonas sp. CCI3.1]MEB0071565.1 SH3 domain-containing protein [Pseudomonas sp. CCI1.4]
MRKKSQSWLVPLLILFAVLWAVGKKDTPPAPAQPGALITPSTLASISPASSSAPAPASTTDQFVSADNLNVRDQPGGKVISKLKRGEKVQVFETRNEWARISIYGQSSKWLSSKSLCSGSGCYVVSKPKPVTQPAQPVRQQIPAYGSSCPCSSGNVCIGPRGGRYCITSGGNKRYGV